MKFLDTLLACKTDLPSPRKNAHIHIHLFSYLIFMTSQDNLSIKSDKNHLETRKVHQYICRTQKREDSAMNYYHKE